MSDKVLTPADVARKAVPPVVTATVRQWADSGKLPCIRTQSGTRIFREVDVDRFLADRQRRAPTAARWRAAGKPEE